MVKKPHIHHIFTIGVVSTSSPPDLKVFDSGGETKGEHARWQKERLEKKNYNILTAKLTA